MSALTAIEAAVKNHSGDFPIPHEEMPVTSVHELTFADLDLAADCILAASSESGA